MGAIKHKRSRTQTHNVWWSMISRCRYKSDTNYKRYGAKGITVCGRWTSGEGFNNFISDMGERPSSKHSIDRVDVYGNYEPGNCRWATRIQQQNNTSRNRFLTYKGETLTHRQWEVRYKMRSGLLRERLSYNWPIDKIFSVLPTPGRKNIGRPGL